MKIYIAGPLFNEMERKRNSEFNKILKSLGFDTYLPQEDGGVAYDLIKSGERSKIDIRKSLFELDYNAVMSCDILLCLLDGRTPDEGTCIELGMAFALNKICIGFKTDSRAMDENGDNNVMIDGCLYRGIFREIDSMIKYLKEINA